jgi:hypothetical protein
MNAAPPQSQYASFFNKFLGFAVLQLICTLAKWGREYLPYEPNTPE